MNRKFKVRSFAAKTAVLIGISLLMPGLSPGADRMVEKALSSKETPALAKVRLGN